MNEIIFPNYEHSILNTINSILKYYNVNNKFTLYDMEFGTKLPENIKINILENK